MIKYLGLASQYPFLQNLGEIYYYGIIAAAGIACILLAARKWHFALGYTKKRVVYFTLFFIAASGPVVYVGSRAAGMFNRPIAEWSINLLIENTLHGQSHTFHGAMIISMIFLALLSRMFKFRVLEILDTAFLYVPLVHAFGRTGCLVVGCCWGQHVNLYFHGFRIGFQNPVPLYAIAVNLAIFIFLRMIYSRIYSGHETRNLFKGAVLTAYLILYPPARIIFEAFRTEPKIFLRLTQAQVVMGLLFLTGIVFLLVIGYRWQKMRSGAAAESNPEEASCAQKTMAELTALFSAAALLASLVIFSFLIYYLTRQIRVWPWPFKPVFSLAEAYGRILYYLPVMLVPAYCLLWLRMSRVPIASWFKWNRFSYTFFIGLAVSVYYCLEMIVFGDMRFRGPAFWPPVVVMSFMNAAAEEIMYRLSLYNLLKRAAFPAWSANIAQALVYSLIHFMVAGAMLGIFSLIYGLIMGVVAGRSRSIIPAFICHFIIDLGVIGMPLLRH